LRWGSQAYGLLALWTFHLRAQSILQGPLDLCRGIGLMAVPNEHLANVCPGEMV